MIWVKQDWKRVSNINHEFIYTFEFKQIYSTFIKTSSNFFKAWCNKTIYCIITIFKQVSNCSKNDAIRLGWVKKFKEFFPWQRHYKNLHSSRLKILAISTFYWVVLILMTLRYFRIVIFVAISNRFWPNCAEALLWPSHFRPHKFNGLFAFFSKFQ